MRSMWVRVPLCNCVHSIMLDSLIFLSEHGCRLHESKHERFSCEESTLTQHNILCMIAQSASVSLQALGKDQSVHISPKSVVSPKPHKKIQTGQTSSIYSRTKKTARPSQAVFSATKGGQAARSWPSITLKISTKMGRKLIRNFSPLILRHIQAFVSQTRSICQGVFLYKQHTFAKRFVWVAA